MTETYTAFMLDHAAGALTPGMSLLADAHLALNAQGRQVNGLWAVIGGVMLEQADFRTSGPVKRSPMPYRCEESSADVIEADPDTLPWRVGLSGVAYAKGRTPHTKFMKLGPGGAAPKHSHSALEATLVLHGAFSDGSRTYERGEIAFGLPGESHVPATVGDTHCVCFVAQDRKPFWRLS